MHAFQIKGMTIDIKTLIEQLKLIQRRDSHFVSATSRVLDDGLATTAFFLTKKYPIVTRVMTINTMRMSTMEERIATSTTRYSD